MASYTLSRSAVAGPSSHSAACLRFPFASSSTSSFHLLPPPSSPSTHASSSSSSSPSRRSFSSSLSSPSAKKRHKIPFVPAATTHSKIVFKSKPNSYYPQNQFQSDANKTADGEERQTHKKAFLGATYTGSAASPDSIPPKGKLQEILFAGRSNTGKSTLLNALLSSHDLVKTSGKPGHTKMLNFFQVPGQMVLVDAPGYGERGRPEWGDTFQFFLTHRPPSPPSLLVLLFTLSHKISSSDLLFLSSLPPSIPLLPIFTKTDLCPVQEIADRKKALNNSILAARESAFVEAQERERRKRMARLGEEFDSGKSARAGLEPEGANEVKEVVKGKTWEGMCVSTKKGWVLRDTTVDAVRSAILSQLQSSLATDRAHRAAHEQALYLQKKAIKQLGGGDRAETSRLLNALEDKQKTAIDDFFASVPGAEIRQKPDSMQTSRADERMGVEEEEEDEDEEEEGRSNARLDPDAGKPGQAWGTKDPFIGSAFGRTRPGGSKIHKNRARK